jgi:cold shock protein
VKRLASPVLPKTHSRPIYTERSGQVGSDRRFDRPLESYFANVEDRLGMLPGGTRPVRPRAGLTSKVRQMINGIVKFYNSGKGFGFIAPDDGGKDAFVHATALEQSGIRGLAEGQKVTYDLESGRDGKVFATNLQLA